MTVVGERALSVTVAFALSVTVAAAFCNGRVTRVTVACSLSGPCLGPARLGNLQAPGACAAPPHDQLKGSKELLNGSKARVFERKERVFERSERGLVEQMEVVLRQGRGRA